MKFLARAFGFEDKLLYLQSFFEEVDRIAGRPYGRSADQSRNEIENIWRGSSDG